MAWTTPRTWVAAETATAANFNTHLRDNLNALYGTDSSYTPTLSQGVSTNIAKTVNAARYIQVGRIVHVWVDLSATAAGTAGSSVTVTLPVTATGHSTNQPIGNGIYYDASATTFYSTAVQFGSTTTVTFITDNATGGAVGSAPNIAVASGDFIRFHAVYVVA